MKKYSSYLVPSLIASVLMSMYAIIDGIFIGQKIGDLGLAGINIGWPITALLQSVGSAIGLSGGIYIQNLLAKKEEEKVRSVKSLILLLVIIFGIIMGFCLYFLREPLIWLLGATEDSFPYATSYIRIILIGSVFQMIGMALIPLLKNSNKVKLAAGASLASMFTNLFLDYLLIVILNMDLVGAAIGSVLSQVVASIICLIAYFKELGIIKIDKTAIKEISVGAIAPFILAYSYSIVIIITNIFCTKYGGDEAVAAYTLLSYLCYIVLATATAVGDSIQPLFSYNHAIGEYEQNKKILNKSYLISIICCVVLAVLMLLFQKPLGKLYNLSDVAYSYFIDGIMYYSIGSLFVAYIKVSASYLYSINSKLFANILVIMEPIVLTPIGIVLFTYAFNDYGLWITYLFVQIALFIISFILIKIIQKPSSFKN